jgi:hypothetical protein
MILVQRPTARVTIAYNANYRRTKRGPNVAESLLWDEIEDTIEEYDDNGNTQLHD